MNDPRRTEWSDPTQRAGSAYPPNPDPAYSGQYYGYEPGYVPPAAHPTEQLPSYWWPGGGYPPSDPPPARSPRWLWILAGFAVLLVVGLVIALVIVTSSSRESTIAVPVPSLTATSTAPNATTTTRIPLPTPSLPALPTPSGAPSAPLPSETTSPTGTDAVVYGVDGEGRAINITYVDAGGVMQTEFNVMLPWRKEVSLSSPARNSASVAVVNVGRDVTCSVSVNGVQLRQRSGRGLTICTGAA